MPNLRYENVWHGKFEDIMHAIVNSDVNVACRTMTSIGMQSAFDSEVKMLIDTCLISKEEWIRRSAYICLYHLYIRDRMKIGNREDFIHYIANGLYDISDVCREMVLEVIDEMKEFSADAYERIRNLSQNSQI